MTADRTSRAPRISDVARHAGVSVGTVSNVLNRAHKVRPDTVERVRESIRALGFIRNANASALAAGSNRAIGLVVIDLSNSMFVDVALGAQAAARAAGLNLLLAGSEDDHALQRQNVEFFDEARVAGLLLAPMQDSVSHIRFLAQHGRPTVVLNYDAGTADMCSVIVDNEHAGYLAARHLIDVGCQRIVFLGGADHLQPVRLRREGVRRAIAESAPRVELEEMPTADLSSAAGTRAAHAMLRSRRRPDGVIGVTDILAGAVLEEMLAAGVGVPQDVAVMGCDHNSTAWGGPVPLTTVAMRGFEVGSAAMQLLAEEITQAAGDSHAHEKIVLDPYLVPRASTRR